MSRPTLCNVMSLSTLVTGAASGIGYAIAEAMAEGGALVTLTDVDPVALEARTAALAARGLRVRAEICDISSPGAAARALHGVVERQGRIDVVFANAGVSAGPGFMMASEGNLEGEGRSRWDSTMKVNLTGAYDTIAAAASHMKAAGSGSIIVTSSISALRASPVSAYAYIAAKAALNAIVKQAAVELGQYNVRINAIAPGFIRTNLAGGKLRSDQAAADDLARRVPLGRIGDPEDVAGLAVFLASSSANYITGTITPVDGGVTAA
jgi:NAD(P)-dependent dehydrogenase (short-subunit alcohol dehydrogenase family)